MKWLKINEIDGGTMLRTVLAIATSLNTALIATDLTGFENPTLDTAYKVISIVLNFIIVALTTYMNNDYTRGASIGTVIGRRYNQDPTMVIEAFDGDMDEEESILPEVDECGDDVIVEGETDEVE